MKQPVTSFIQTGGHFLGTSLTFIDFVRVIFTKVFIYYGFGISFVTMGK